MTTILYRDRSTEVSDATVDGDDLWLDATDLLSATGWELKPEGACKGDICIPIPRDRTAEFQRPDDRYNLSALAGLLEEPVLHDEQATTWVFGESAGARRDALASLDAPDFTLPDLDGRLHSLSEQRGKKILLASWASW